MNNPDVIIIGGGLAGCEAAWQLISQQIQVLMVEMRPVKQTAAHQTGNLAELVCSNSLKSLDELSAPGLLKRDMAHLNSLIVAAAGDARVPAGQALAVDRGKFSAAITERLHASPYFRLEQREFTELRELKKPVIVATGPLTSTSLAAELSSLIGGDERLYFYDAIAPILAADSIDMTKAFCASRYDKGGEGDYINIPLTKSEYETFIADINSAEMMPLHDFEKPKYFEACLPIEVMASRGPETLRFGPMKPVGLIDPRDGSRPWAVIQARYENTQKTMVSLVGFQTKMKWPEQARVLRKIPALAEVEFLRFGSVHRNTYIESPKVLNDELALSNKPNIWLAGQITGVEGYTESAAIGLVVGRVVAGKVHGKPFLLPPKQSMLGALVDYVRFGVKGPYQPMNTNLGLLEPAPYLKGTGKAERKKQTALIARKAFDDYFLSLSETAVRTIFKKSAATSEAPPISAPSTLG